MTIDNRFSESFDLNAVNNLEEIEAIVRELKPKIGFFGGRKFSYQDKICFRFNDIVKRAVFLAKKTMEESGSDLTAVQALHINVIQHELVYLNIQGNKLLHDPKKTSGLRKFLTYCSQFFGNLFYFGALDYSRRELSALSKSYSRRDFPFKPGNETLSTIDRNILIEILVNLVKKPLMLSFFERYIFGNKNLQPNEVIQLIPTLHLDKNVPREKELLLQFAKLNIIRQGYDGHFKGMTFDEFVNLGFDPQADRELMIDFFLQCVEGDGEPEIVMEAFRRLGVTPLEQEGLEIWKKLINRCSKARVYYIYTHMKNMGINPFDEQHLMVYIELLRLCLQKASYRLEDMKKITGLDISSLQELKVLTNLIQTLSQEEEKDKNIWEFIKKNEINGLTQVEKEYLQWLLENDQLFNIHGALPPGKVPQGINLSELEQLPFEIMKQVMRKLDLSSLGVVLLSSKHSHIVNAAWLSLLAQDRSQRKKYDDLRDLTNFLSPLSIVEQIIRLGPEIEELDLTGVFHFKSWDQPWNEKQLEVLRKIFQSCPRLRSLRIKNCGKISQEVIDPFPTTLQELDFGGGTVSTSVILPPHVKELRIYIDFDDFKKLFSNNFQELLTLLPEDIEKLSIDNGNEMTYRQVNDMVQTLTTKFKHLRMLDISRIEMTLKKQEMIESRLPDLIVGLRCYHWNGTFRELIPYLPIRIKNLDFQFGYNNPFRITKEDFEYLPKTLQNLFLCEDVFSKNNMGVLPEHIKRFGLLHWNSDFRELLPFLHKDLEKLKVCVINGRKFVDEDIEHLPAGLKVLRILHGNAALTKEGKKALKDKGITLLES